MHRGGLYLECDLVLAAAPLGGAASCARAGAGQGHGSKIAFDVHGNSVDLVLDIVLCSVHVV